ncbi:rab-GTPase-TBC domain-containing protein [Ampelomyces quisqualis]|uniref:Rab-GTPase-TBC domain-containing protein n=1 Tax=Ampelomyces quisqualis TaxID=50730 RepID=A0A6A5R1X2_AMPQU|nr:rab-GTPase-TBC domain-containing protein [Ampelomyces quisqualis]
MGDDSRHGDCGIMPESAASSKLSFLSYRPPEFTPPASPQPHYPYAARRGFGSARSKRPAQLQMDNPNSPTYDGPPYSPNSWSSPPPPPIGLPSPKYPARQRAPSLLRHAAVPPTSFTSAPHTRTEKSGASPMIAPAMMRQGSGPGSPDLRTIYNPLASNPVNQSGPNWTPLTDVVSHPATSQRNRGMTSSSQASVQSNPPLRSVTSIPDYRQLRTNNRANLSGTYKPNRGVPNWSHTDYYPPPSRPFRGEEPRASFRSGWTNASSSLMEASETERSSIATARSSVASDHQASICSRDQSRDRLRDRNESPEHMQLSETPEDDYDMDAVDDVIDAYCYDEDDDNMDAIESFGHATHDRFSASPTLSDSEPPELTQTPSRELDSLVSFHSSDRLKAWDERPSSYLQDSSDSNTEQFSPRHERPGVVATPTVICSDIASFPPRNGPNVEPSARNIFSKNDLSPLRMNPPPSQHGSQNSEEKHQPSTLQRSSEELPRRMSVSVHALALGGSIAKQPSTLTYHKTYVSSCRNVDRSQMTNIQRDISKLPQLPMNRSRLSRQDWAEIQAYSQRHSKRPSALRALSKDALVGREIPVPLQSPPRKKSVPLPEVDEDEAIPRRASTSVYDRKSALFDSGMMAAGGPTSPKLTPAAISMQRPQLTTDGPSQVRKATSPIERDRYGFKKASDKISVQKYNVWATKYEEHISRRRNKWIALMSKNGLSTTEPTKFPEKCDKVKRYARKGYPPEWRGAMWWYYSGGQHLITQTEMVGLYASLVARVKRDELNKDDKDAIERDLDRTFPDNIHFRPEAATDLLDGESDEEPKLIQDLREVLSCFALNNPNIGYCQSLNFIAGLLLLFLKQDKEKAFIMLTIITQNHLPGAHARSLANTEVNVLMMLIKDYLPKVWGSINDTDLINSGAGSNAHPDSKFQRQPTVALSCTSWFMSIFVGVLPIETVLRVWDTFLYEGPRALYRYALAIFKLSEPDIRKYRPIDPEIFMIVQNLPRTCLDPNILYELAFVKKGFGNLSQSVIDQKRLFWREQNKIAHQVSTRGTRRHQPAPPSKDDETDNDSLKKSMDELRGKASRQFRRMRK